MVDDDATGNERGGNDISTYEDRVSSGVVVWKGYDPWYIGAEVRKAAVESTCPVFDCAGLKVDVYRYNN